MDDITYGVWTGIYLGLDSEILQIYCHFLVLIIQIFCLTSTYEARFYYQSHDEVRAMALWMCCLRLGCIT
jgi:hypothetical protein